MAVAPIYKPNDPTPISVESLLGNGPAKACFAAERNLPVEREKLISRALSLIADKRAQLQPAQLAALEYEAALMGVKDNVTAAMQASAPEEIFTYAKAAAESLDNAKLIGGEYGLAVPPEAQNAVLAALEKAYLSVPRNSAQALAIESDAQRAASTDMPLEAPANQKSVYPWIMAVVTLFGMTT